MKRKIQLPLLLLVCIGIIVALPSMVSAASKNTKTTYYISNSTNLPKYNNQTTVVVNSVSQNSYTYSSRTPYMKKVTKVIISNKVTKLPENFFAKFPNLSEIQFPKNFYGRAALPNLRVKKNLKTIKVASGNKYFKVKNNVLYSYNMKQILVYPNAKADKTFTIPNTVTTTPYCFGINPYLKKLTLGKNMKSFMTTYRTIQNEKFLPNLTTIKVVAGNTNFHTYDGALYSTKNKTLLYCAKGKSNPYTVKAGTTAIGKQAFWGCNIKEITLPKSLKTIGTEVFCNSLESITVAQGCEAFYSCDGVLYSAKSKLLHFPYSKSRKVVHIPDQATSFSLKDIGGNYTEIETLYIGKNLSKLTSVSENNIKEVFLDSENTNYKLEQNVLYTADYSSIELYPNQNKITKIKFNENLKSLNVDLFSTPNNTVELTLPAKLETVVMGAYSYEDLDSHYIASLRNIPFYGFQKLEKLTISEENQHFSAIDNVLYNKEQTLLVWYPIGRTNSSYSLPETVTEIAFRQLCAANQLEHLTLNASVTDSQLQFVGFAAPKLQSITVDSNNTKYASEDGVFYNKAKTILYAYPMSKRDTTFTMPTTVKKAYFYFTNYYVEKIVLSPNLTVLDNYCADNTEEGPLLFSQFPKLKTVVNQNPKLEVVSPGNYTVISK